MARPLIIAIDGPSGVGKGTVARAVAQALGYRHVDTGVMYRVVAWRARGEGVAWDDEPGLVDVAERVASAWDEATVLADDADLARAIRTNEIDRGASAVARLPKVREVLVRRQRAMREAGGLVMEGRDIGTVVFPDADVKVYLDASPEERARRRARDAAHESAGSVGLAEVASSMAARDAQDSTRATSPLAVALHAVVIDTTALSVEQVVDRVMGVVRAAGGAQRGD
jgi:cytidylate kinase